MVTADAIAAVLKAEADPEAAARQLLALAIAGGGRDNITVVMVRFDPATPSAAG